MSHVQSPRKVEAERAARHRKNKLMSWGLLVFTFGVILLVMQMAFDISKWFDLLASLILLSGIAIALCGVLVGILERKSAESASADPNQLSVPETTKQDETKAKE